MIRRLAGVASRSAAKRVRNLALLVAFGVLAVVGCKAAHASETVDFQGRSVPREIVETIVRASKDVGVDPVYMMALAEQESGFRVTVKASTSSAQGLYQFISSTWLDVVDEFGERHGLKDEATAIQNDDGETWVKDRKMRKRILGLRHDPYLSAVMAAEMLKKDRATIELKIGRKLRQSEYYLPHFFGVDAATRLMELVENKPERIARKVFPKAARANKSLFYVKTTKIKTAIKRKGKGKKRRHVKVKVRVRVLRPLSVVEVYEKIHGLIDNRLGRYRDMEETAKSNEPRASA